MGSDPAWVMGCDHRFKKKKDKEGSGSGSAAEDFSGMHKTLVQSSTPPNRKRKDA